MKKFIPPHTAQEFASPPKPDDEYAPAHSLIHKVRIFNWKTSYNYYEQFLRHARKINNIASSECQPVPFFSYVPQFSQLSRQQLQWYLWWRTCAISGRYLKSDYSYILLFIYEIINTGGHGNPAWGQSQLCGVWKAYREEFPRFDRMLGEWICDFSLIFHLPPPDIKSYGIPAVAVQSCTLKEFFMSSKDGAEDGYCNMLLTFCTNYDYKTSKFARGDALPLFDTHIRNSLAATVKRFSNDSGQLLSGAGLEDSHIIRDAFAGALCSYEVKKKIEADYCSFSRTHELRFLVTDIIKYSENKIRAYLGIKSRLSVFALPAPMRACIDEYFAGALPKKRKAAEPEIHDYDKYYNLPIKGASHERAAEIEQASWETTERLAAAFEEKGTSVNNDGGLRSPVDEMFDEMSGRSSTAPENQGDKDVHKAAGEQCLTLAERLGDFIEFVRLADRRDYSGQLSFASERGMLPDYIADRINEISAGTIGDVILAEDGEGYSFIEDYRKEVFDD